MLNNYAGLNSSCVYYVYWFGGECDYTICIIRGTMDEAYCLHTINTSCLLLLRGKSINGTHIYINIIISTHTICTSTLLYINI